ncbi:V-set and immunoglobulin domain-containing protein 2-like [Anoplopoma fimbria]|uniref:V-set and immunoglobulin domain-containing protein 2-like n=1 Tax=Anoplopoma fimbria TaxID=229290 RepID=UPI0023ED43D4|nr:V-set and immunoglobulin domain-containing protein 2-like [Anoplopoma fimbria]
MLMYLAQSNAVPKCSLKELLARLSTLLWLSTFNIESRLGHLSAGIQSAAVKQDTGIISTNVGDNVTLHCFYNTQVAMHFSWYRQTLGGKPELLSNFYKYDNPSKVFPWLEKNPRFSVQRKEGMNHLNISDVHLSDSATYFCGSTHSNTAEFGEGIFLSVKGASLEEIVQWPVSETIQPGGTVTFKCTAHSGTCDGEHSVYWFRHGSGQGVLHTRGDQCKHVSTPPGSPSQSCVYHWQKKNLSSSDAGTYYCAVASCVEVMFGNGSKLLVKGDGEDQRAQMRTLVWLSIIRTAILVFFVTFCLLVYISKSC